MKSHVFSRIACCLMGLALLPVGSASAQATWYDINPSRSNTDDDNPNGASGGRVNRVGAASDLSRIYAATEWGGLYTSFDQGNTWTRINTFSPSAAWDVKVDPRNSQLVYATSFFDGRANPRSGISISTDAGNTWTTVNIPALNTLTCVQASRRTQPHAWQIAINAGNPRTVFIGTSCGLGRTLDSGATWTFIDPSPGDNAEQIYAVAAHGRQTVDVIGDNGHLRSNDNGATWSPVPPVAGPGPTSGNSPALSTLAVSPAEPWVLLAASQNNIFESQDGGATWPTSLTLPLRAGNSNQQGRIPFIKTNQQSTSNQFDVWFGDVNVFKTTAISTNGPGGAARTPLNSWINMQDDGHWDVGDVLFDPRFASGACPALFTSDGGIYRNTTPSNPECQFAQWEQPTITPHATWLFGMDGIQVLPGVHALTYGLQDNGGYAATNVFEGHNPPTPGWNNYTCCDVLHNSQNTSHIVDLEGAAASGRTFRLNLRNRDGGGENEIDNYPSTAAAVFTRFESGRQNVPFGTNGAVVNISDGVYFSNDITGSIAWSSLNAPAVPGSGTGNLKVANLGGRPNVYYHTGNGNPESTGLIFRSTLVGNITAPGTNWVPLTLPPGIGSATAWDVDPNNGNRVIISGINAATNNFEVWMTSDFAATPWTRLTNLETQMLGVTAAGNTFLNRTAQGRNTGTFAFGTYWQPSLFKFNPLDPTTILAGAVDAGVLLSLDNGTNWQVISNPTNPTSNSPHIPRPLFAYFSPGRFAASTNAFDVWVGTRGAGVMKVVFERRR